MGLLITKSDFTGVYALSTSISDKITAYIAEYEEKYLRELLGVTLFNSFKADVNSYLPQTAKYLTIFNEINSDEYGFLLHSDGMKKMILGFVYYEFIVGTTIQHTNTGLVANVNEISVNADFSLAMMVYNKSIDTYRNIQYYIEQNGNNYEDFAGVGKRLISSF
jgi:hypothetical protein